MLPDRPASVLSTTAALGAPHLPVVLVWFSRRCGAGFVGKAPMRLPERAGGTAEHRDVDPHAADNVRRMFDLYAYER